MNKPSIHTGTYTSVAGIDKLTTHLRTLLDDARRSGETIEIVDNGEVVAHIVPRLKPAPDLHAATDDQDRRARDTAIWADIDRLAEEIGKEWPEGVSAVDAVRDVRREL